MMIYGIAMRALMRRSIRLEEVAPAMILLSSDLLTGGFRRQSPAAIMAWSTAASQTWARS